MAQNDPDVSNADQQLKKFRALIENKLSGTEEGRKALDNLRQAGVAKMSGADHRTIENTLMNEPALVKFALDMAGNHIGDRTIDNLKKTPEGNALAEKLNTLGHEKTISQITPGEAKLLMQGTGARTLLLAAVDEVFSPAQPKPEPRRDFTLTVHKGPGVIPVNDDVLAAQKLMKELKGLEPEKLKGIDLGHFGANKDGLDGRFGKMTHGSVIAMEKYLGIDPPTGKITDELVEKMKAKRDELSPHITQAKHDSGAGPHIISTKISAIEMLGDDMARAADKLHATPEGLALLERVKGKSLDQMSGLDRTMIMDAMGGEKHVNTLVNDYVHSMDRAWGMELPTAAARVDTAKGPAARDPFEVLDNASQAHMKREAERPALAEAAKQEMLGQMKQSGISELVRHRASSAYDQAVAAGQPIENLNGIARVMGGGNENAIARVEAANARYAGDPVIQSQRAFAHAGDNPVLQQSLANHEVTDVAIVQGDREKAKQMMLDSGMDVARASIENDPGVGANPKADAGLVLAGSGTPKNSAFTV